MVGNHRSAPTFPEKKNPALDMELLRERDFYSSKPKRGVPESESYGK